MIFPSRKERRRLFKIYRYELANVLSTQPFAVVEESSEGGLVSGFDSYDDAMNYIRLLDPKGAPVHFIEKYPDLTDPLVTILPR